MEKYKIVSMEIPFRNMRIIKLEPLSGKLPVYEPGQFVFLHILEEDKTIVRRPYSLASAPSAPYLEFAIRLVDGEFTGRLERMNVGDIIGVEGPVGNMVLGDQKKAGFICGGTGLVPFMSILRHIAEKKIKGDFILFYSVRTKDRILYKEELFNLQKMNSSIRIVITLTRETGEWKGEKGRISSQMIRKYVENPEEYGWFICGSQGFLKSMRECLEEVGVDPKKLKMEGWG